MKNKKNKSSSSSPASSSSSPFVLRKWTSVSSSTPVSIGLPPGFDCHRLSVRALRGALVRSGHARTNEGVCFWVSYSPNEEVSSTTSTVLGGGDATLRAYLDNPYLDHVVSHIMANVRANSDPRFGDVLNGRVSRERVYKMLLAMHEQPLSDKALRALDVVVGPNDKNAIVVSDHVSLQHFTSAAMRFFASEGSVAYRRMGVRYVQQTTSSDVLLNAWSVNPFEPQLPLVERGDEDPDAWSSSSSRLNVAESPFEFETIGDLLTWGIDKSSRLMVVNFATIEDVLGKSKHKSSPSRGFVLKYFPLTPSRVGTTSSTNTSSSSSVGPGVIIAPNPSNPLVEVVSIEVRSVVAVARASPSFYRMLPSIRGLFSDTIPAIFGRLMSGSGDLKDLHAVQLMNGVLDNLGRSVSLKVRRSTVYEDPAMFRQVFRWLRRPPSSDCRMRAFVSLDSVGGGVAIVSFDDDLSVNVSFQRIPDASRIPDAVRLVNMVCIGEANDALDRIDCPVRIRPLVSVGDSSLEWDARDSRYVISVEDRRGEHGKLVKDLREDILNFDAITPPSKSQFLSYRGVSGYTDPRNLFKAVANMRQLSKTDAVRLIRSRFDHLTQDQCEEAIDADRSSSDALSVVSALTLEPMLQVQSRGAFSYSITLENARPHVMMRIAGIIGRVRSISELSASMLQVGGGGELLNASNNDFLNSEADMLFGALSQEDSPEKNLHTGSSRSGRSNYVTKNGDSSVPRSFLLESLYRADPNLFSGTTYSKMCPHVDKRQPVVVTREEFDVLPSNSYGDRAIAYGSSKETSERNIYICPTVWCPMSRVSMTRDQLVSAGGRCPGGPAEEPILYDSKYFRKSKNKNHRHVGFLDPSKHPSGLCLPCCFNKPGKRVDQCEAKDAGGGSGKTSSNNITGSTNRKTKNRTDEKHVSVSSPSSRNITSFSRYVMHSGVVPLPVNGRLGALHSVLVSSQDDEDHTSIIVRVGSSGTPLDTSLLRALADVYTSGDVRVFLLSVHDVLVKSPGIFVAMGDGYVCSRFMRGGDARDTLSSPSIFEAFLVHMRSGSYATIFGLDSILLPLLGKVSRPQLLKEYDSEAVDATWAALIRELCIFGAFSRFLVALEEDNNLALSRPDVDAIADLMGTITGRLTVTLSVGGSCVSRRSNNSTSNAETRIHLPSLHTLERASSFCILLEQFVGGRSVVERLGIRGEQRASLEHFIPLDDNSNVPPPLIVTAVRQSLAKLQKGVHPPVKNSHVKSSPLRIHLIAEVFLGNGNNGFRVKMLSPKSSMIPFLLNSKSVSVGGLFVYVDEFQHHVDDRVFMSPWERDLRSRDMVRDVLRRDVSMAIRSDLQLLFHLSSIRSTASRPRENVPIARKDVVAMIYGIIRTPKRNVRDDDVYWLADILLFSDEPLTIRRGTASFHVIDGGDDNKNIMFFKDVREFDRVTYNGRSCIPADF